jgi:poly(glycerol-phosphate) alpha-glucosyltransferase
MTPEPLRVAHFSLGRCNPDSANGVDKTVFHLARSQAALGQTVAVFSLTEKPSVPIPGVSVSTCPPLRLPLPFLTERQYDLLVSRAPWNVPRQLVRQIREWQPDILHLHFVHIPTNVFLTRRLSPAVPYCVTINGGLSPVAQRRRRWMKRAFKVLFEREYFNRAAFLHAISDQDVQGLRSYGVTNNIIVAPNGIEVDPTPAAFDETVYSQLDDRLRGRRLFLYLGRIDPEQKGLDLLLRAFAACRPDNSALVLAGPSWRGGRHQLEQLASSLGMEDRVIFAGPVFGPRKNDFIRAADVFVHPSRWEAGVPFSVLEAAAFERPCLLTVAADSDAILARGGGAVSVSPDLDGIAAGLRQMADAPVDTLRAMGARAREIVISDFSWCRTAGLIIEGYRRAVERRE